jgi:hypothetical protein
MVLLVVFLSTGSWSADTGCDTGGFQTLNVYYWAEIDNWGNSETALVAWREITPHYLGIKGSYIAHEEGAHWFRVRRSIYSGSSSRPDFWYNCEHEQMVVSSGEEYWDGGAYVFYPYFRYRVCVRYEEGQNTPNSELEIQIKIGDSEPVIMTKDNGGRACEQSGCEDMLLSPAVWSCRPNPPSQTISQTPAPSPSITASATPMPSQEFSPFPQARRGTIVRTHVFHFMFISLPLLPP